MRVAPFGALVGVALLVYAGHAWVAVAFCAALFAVLQARMVSPRFKRGLEHRLARTAHAVALGVGLILSWTLLLIVFVVVIVPVSLIALVLRRPLGRPRGLGGAGWIPRAALSRAPRSPRMFGPEPTRVSATQKEALAFASHERVEPEDDAERVDENAVDERVDDAGAGADPRPGHRPRRRAPRLVTALGIVAALVLVDLAVGAGMTLAGFVPDDRGETRRDIEHAVGTTMAAPAIADEPWADDYRDALIEYELGNDSYEPYLVRHQREFRSAYLNTTEAERVSYDPAVGTDDDPVRIAFLGGSVMFGVGQRDEHTIPSEVARIAEDDGVAVEVHNYGLPGWVAWQELQYLERLLAAGETYDLVVFYDGFNEFLVQHAGFSVNPTHIGISTISQLAADFHQLHETDPTPTSGLQEVGSAYVRASGVGRMYDRFFGDEPLGDGEVASPATPEQQTDAALGIYERATTIVDDLLAERDTEVRYFWQPMKAGWDPSVTEALPAGVTDLSHALDGREDELYIDEVHTNEEGARLMAEAIWDELRPQIEAAADR